MIDSNKIAQIGYKQELYDKINPFKGEQRIKA